MKRVTWAPKTGLLAVDPKAWGGEFLIFEAAASEAFDVQGDRAIVDICGPLMQRHHWCHDSYEDIQKRCQAAFDSSASTVVLRIDSPGGEATGCFDLARWLRLAAVSTGKTLIAYTDGKCCSAAYAIACAAQKIYASESAVVGSIGVIEGICDTTALDSAMGLRFVFAMSGARKADGNPHVPVSKDTFAAMQSQVDSMAGMFFALVAEMREMAPEAVSGLNAATFLGRDSLSLGLVDGVMPWAGLVSASTGEIEGDKPMAKKLTEYLASVAEGEDKEEAAKARKALAALVAEEKEPDGDEKSAPKEEPKEEAKAATEEKEMKAEKEEKGMKAAASANIPEVAVLARKLHSLEAERAAEKDMLARSAILAKRPDLGADAVKALASVPTSSLQSVLDTFPVIPNLAAASQVTGTRGEAEGDGLSHAGSSAEESFIAAKMSMGAPEPQFGARGRDHVFGFMNKSQAAQKLAALTKEGGK